MNKRQRKKAEKKDGGFAGVLASIKTSGGVAVFWDPKDAPPWIGPPLTHVWFEGKLCRWVPGVKAMVVG